MLVANANRDAFVRHAGAHAIARIGSRSFVYRHLDHEDKAVRDAALRTLARRNKVGMKPFLLDLAENDESELVRKTAKEIQAKRDAWLRGER